MPPRDDQDFEQRRQQIIDGALAVFSTKGFEKATNKDIADAAGIGSPGLIYHYFKDKADLLREVMEQRAPVLQLINRGEELMDLPPREALTRFAEAFVKTVSRPVAVSVFKLMMGEAIRQPAVAQMVSEIGPARGVRFLRRYLERQMELGTLRRMDSGAAARCLVGPLLAYLLTREVYRLPDNADLSAELMAQTAVEIFLNGMQVEREEPSMRQAADG